MPHRFGRSRIANINHTQAADTVSNEEVVPRLSHSTGRNGLDECKPIEGPWVRHIEHVNSAPPLTGVEDLAIALKWIAVQLQVNHIGKHELAKGYRPRQVLPIESNGLDTTSIRYKGYLTAQLKIRGAQTPGPAGTVALHTPASRRAGGVHLVVDHGHPRQPGRGLWHDLVENARAVFPVNGPHCGEAGHVGCNPTLFIQARIERFPAGKHFLLGSYAPLSAPPRNQVHLSQTFVAVKVKAKKVHIPSRVAGIALEFPVVAVHRPHGRGNVIGMLWINHIHDLLDRVGLPRDLALQ